MKHAFGLDWHFEQAWVSNNRCEKSESVPHRSYGDAKSIHERRSPPDTFPRLNPDGQAYRSGEFGSETLTGEERAGKELQGQYS